MDLLAQLGLPHRRVELSQLTADTARAEFRAINPIGKVPTLVFDDGRMLSESGAILHYLAAGTRFWPEDRWQQAQVLRWMFFEQYSHEPNIATVRAWITHQVEMTPERQAALPGKRTQGVAALDVMERHLTTRRFFVGDRYTITDIALYAYTHVAHEGGFDLSPFGAVRAWLGRVAAEPGHLAITA
jgi:glutathione S-transferase